MCRLPPFATTVDLGPLPVPVRFMLPPVQLSVPATEKLPLPSSAPAVRPSVPLRVTLAVLLAVVEPATTVAPSTDVPDRLDPSAWVKVPPTRETRPGEVPVKLPVAATPPPLSCRVPAVAPTAPPFCSGNDTVETAAPA